MAIWVHWFRRDFRVRDNAGLLAAAERAGRDGGVIGVFVIDPRWWAAERGKLGPFQARFWLESLRELAAALAEKNIPLVIRAGDPVECVRAVAREVSAEGVTFNKEYEPGQLAADARLERGAAGLVVLAVKDASVFEEEEILTGQGTTYTVFTPYKRAYLKRLAESGLEVGGVPRRLARAVRVATEKIPVVGALGFADVPLDVLPGERAAGRMLEGFIARGVERYAETRDFPALAGSSRLSAHLNAGTISIRQVMRAVIERRAAVRKAAAKGSLDVFLSELIWREFYRMILFFHGHTVSRAFQARYRDLPWANDARLIEAWQIGRTGYPIVDAAMGQLRATGFMHNRLRMITAMFLTKNLDVHWTIGERFFRRMLVDYDQASNVGGWQWSASTGTDAAPYFRVMNPLRQSERWDPDGTFIRRFVPALARVPAEFVHEPWRMSAEEQRRAGCVIGTDYPGPVVDYAETKAAAVEKFRRAGREGRL